MSISHTPGPWKLDSEPSFHRSRVWTQDMRPIVNLLPMGTSIAEYCPEAQANACLIAAAPELLSALETVMANNRTGATGQIARDGWAKARAAISKATSRQPEGER